MNTGKDLARAIRKRARERLRRSRALWRDYKKLRGSRLRRELNRLRFLLYFYPLLLLAGIAQRHGPTLPLLLLSLYSMATIFARGAQHSSALYRSGDLAFFMHLPVPDSQFFDYQTRKFFWSSLVVWFFAFVAFLYVATLSLSGPMLWVAPLAGATLQWLLVVSLALLVEWLAPVWVGMGVNVGLPFYGLAFAALFLPPAWIEAFKNGLIPLPTAWVPFIFEQGLLHGQSASLFFLFPVIAIIAALPLGLRRLRLTYPRSEILYPLMAGSVAAGDEDLDDRELQQWSVATDVYSGERGVRGAFRPEPLKLPIVDWSSLGWMERLACRCIGPTRLHHAEFLCADQISWSAAWRVGLKIAAAGALLLLVWRDIPLWIPWMIGVVATMVLLPLAGGTWPGMQFRPAGGTNVMPVYATMPVSFAQISRVLVTVNLVRFLVVLPFFLTYGTLLGWRMQMSIADALWATIRIFILLLSLQPFVILLRHSEGTTDTRSLKFSTLGVLFVLLALVGIYLACALAFFVLTEPDSVGVWRLVGLACAVGMVLSSFLSWALYKRLYDRGRIDLLHTAKHY